MFHTVFSLSLKDALNGVSIGKADLSAPIASGESIAFPDGLYRVSGVLHQDQGDGYLPWAIVTKVPSPDKKAAAE